MNKTFPAALSALVLALAAGSASAQVANGSFNGLAGWATAGDAASVGGNHLVLTNAFPDGSDDADGVVRNLSGNAPLAAGGDLEGFVGIAPGALDVDTANGLQAYEGSAASQSFFAAAGSQLVFQWNLGTTETSTDPSLADLAFVVIDGQLITLGNTLAATAAGSGDYALQTGWSGFSTTFATGGTHTVAFGIVDEGQYIDTSALSVTDVGVVVSSVPETSSLALMVAGLGLLGLQVRRRRKG